MAILKIITRISLIGLLFVLCVLLCACSFTGQQDHLIERLDAINRPFDLSVTPQGGTPAGEPVQLNIVSIGDILMHYPWQREFDSAGNSVFPEYFQYINDLTSNADLALCNIEAPFAGGEPAGYPLFNMGDTMAPAVKEAGFDVVYTAHNHMLDQQSDAVFRTVEVLRNANLLTTGSRLDVNEPNYAFVETKGVKIAIGAYTYESNPGAINGLPIPAHMTPYINSYTASYTEDLAEMKAVVDAGRAAGADLVVFYLHDGIEYSHVPSYEQRSVAQFLIDNGVDIIFCSHVHVVQPIELVTPTNGGTPVPVYWGMGNYISGQVVEWGMEPANEVGILADLNLTWNPATRQIDTIDMKYLPLWNTHYTSGGRMVNTVIPLRDDMDVATNPSIQISGHLQRALSAFDEVHAIVGDNISWQRS